MSYSGICLNGPLKGQKRVALKASFTVRVMPPVPFDSAPESTVETIQYGYGWTEHGWTLVWQSPPATPAEKITSLDEAERQIHVAADVFQEHFVEAAKSFSMELARVIDSLDMPPEKILMLRPIILHHIDRVVSGGKAEVEKHLGGK